MTRSEILQIARPILFNTDMVRAILDDRKTETRRVIKTAKGKILECDSRINIYGYIFARVENDGEQWLEEIRAIYEPGDYLYVRETWGVYNRNWWEADYFMYRADYPDGAITYKFDEHICDLPKWRPSIHMPKEAARIFLRVTDVRVERLQDITQAEAISEGVLNSKQCETPEYQEAVSSALKSGAKPPLGYTPIERFVGVWNSTLKKSDLDRYGWDENPWVWAIEFERVEVER